jgi:hypothetical protein
MVLIERFVQASPVSVMNYIFTPVLEAVSKEM